MSLPVYPLADGTVSAEAAAVAHAVAWRHGPGPVQVRLELGAGGWLVTGPHGYLGMIDEEFTSRYPEMLRVFQSGYVAGTTGQVRLRDGGSGALSVSVDVPAAPFAVPVGLVDDGVEVLTQGAALKLDPAVEFFRPCQLLVELDAVGERVVALLDGRLIGGIVHPPQPLLDALRTRRLAARAFVLGDAAVLDIATSLQSAALPGLRVPDPEVLAAEEPDPSPLLLIDTADIALEPAEKRR